MNATVKQHLVNEIGNLQSDTRMTDFIIHNGRKVPVWCFNNKTTSFYYSIMDDPSGEDCVRVIATDNWSDKRRKSDSAAVRYFNNKDYKGKPKAEADDIIAFINSKYDYLSKNTQMDKVYD